MRVLCLASSVLLAGLTPHPSEAQLVAVDSQKVYESQGQKFVVEQLAKRDDVVWGFDFLPNKDLLFTQRGGKLFRLSQDGKSITEVSGTPKVWAMGEAGLLDITVDPNFEKTSLIYIAYTKPVGEVGTPALGRGRLNGNKIEEFKELFAANTLSTHYFHFGSRVLLDGKGHLYLSVGDRYERDQAQNLKSHLGKVIRLNKDGSIPSDNPYFGRKVAQAEIWSLGHRNVQGLALHPVTGELWASELGPRGGDEVNLVRKSANYGWPIITHGVEDDGKKVGKGLRAKNGLEQPVVYWAPASVSPSGMSFYNGAAFPKWNGSLFVGMLSGQHVRRIQFKPGSNEVMEQETLLADLTARFRNVKQGPEGFLYLSLDDGRILRLKPASQLSK